jgi:glycosyltransferase involved in cell wall biosynthesis
MVDWKGFDDLIQAFALVLQNHQGSASLSLWLGGEGPERHHLEALVRDLSIEDNVRFLGFMRDIRPVLWASDLYVHPSWGKEAFGLILLEALASGLPCIATRNGGITDIVKDGESGLLIPGRDPLKMADAISKMLRDENRTYFAGNSLEAASVFDLPRVVEATLAVYRSFEKSL